MAICKGVKRDGNPCSKTGKYNGYCFWHKAQATFSDTTKKIIGVTTITTVIIIAVLSIIVLNVYSNPMVGAIWPIDIVLRGKGTFYACPQTHGEYYTVWGVDIDPIGIFFKDGSNRTGYLIKTGENKGCLIFRTVGRDGLKTKIQFRSLELKPGHHHIKFKFGTAKKGYVYADAYNLATLPESDYIIDGNRVYINDSKVYFSITPHTLEPPFKNTYEITFKSKIYSGPIKMGILVDSNAIKFEKPEIRDPKYITVERSMTCPDRYSVWKNSTHVRCYNETNDPSNIETYYDVLHRYDRIDIPSRTAYWNDTIYQEYRPLGIKFSSKSINHQGMNKLFYAQTGDIIANQTYTIRAKAWINASTEGNKHKTITCIWPAFETFDEAVANDHAYCIDPWWSEMSKTILFLHDGSLTGDDGNLWTWIDSNYSTYVQQGMFRDDGTLFDNATNNVLTIGDYKLVVMTYYETDSTIPSNWSDPNTYDTLRDYIESTGGSLYVGGAMSKELYEIGFATNDVASCADYATANNDGVGISIAGHDIFTTPYTIADNTDISDDSFGSWNHMQCGWTDATPSGAQKLGVLDRAASIHGIIEMNSSTNASLSGFVIALEPLIFRDYTSGSNNFYNDLTALTNNIVEYLGSKSQVTGDVSPTVTLNYPTDDSTNESTTINFGYTPDDDSGILNATLWTNSTGTWALNRTNQSTITNGSVNTITPATSIPDHISIIWNIEVCDNASAGSQCAFATNNFTVTIDSEAPDITIESPTNTSDSDITPMLNATFTNAPNGTVYAIDLGTNTTGIGGQTNLTILSLSSLSDGSHQVDVWVNNSFDHIHQATVWFTIASSITISVDRPLNQSGTDTTPELNTSMGGGDLDVMWYSVNSTANSSAQSSPINISLSILPDGTHDVRVCGNDTADNQGCTQVYFTVDTTAPVITHTTPLNNTQVNNDTIMYLNGTVTDAFAGLDSIVANGSIWNGTDTTSPYNFSNGTLVEVGNYTVRITANDTLNNTLSIDIYFEVVESNTDANFQIWNGTGWDDAKLWYLAFLPQINCTISGCTYPKNITDSSQSDSQGIYNITNNGTGSGDAQMKINITFGGATLKCGNTNDPNSATNMTTSYQTLESDLASNDDAEIWCWADISGLVGQLFYEVQAQVI